MRETWCNKYQNLLSFSDSFEGDFENLLRPTPLILNSNKRNKSSPRLLKIWDQFDTQNKIKTVWKFILRAREVSCVCCAKNLKLLVYVILLLLYKLEIPLCLLTKWLQSCATIKVYFMITITISSAFISFIYWRQTIWNMTKWRSHFFNNSPFFEISVFVKGRQSGIFYLISP